jgi:hypothetical protein
VLPDKKDLLPDGRLNPKGMTHSPVREFRIHYRVGPDKEVRACGHDVDGNGSCWLCDVMIPQLMKNPNKRKYAEDLEAANVFVVNASRFNTDTQKFEPAKPFKPSNSGPNGLAVKIYSRIANSKKDFIDPVKGHNMTITKTGEGLNTRYPGLEGDDSPTVVPRSILAAMKDLDEIVPDPYDEESMKAAFYGRAVEPEEDSGEEEATEEETSEEVEDDGSAEDTGEVEEEPSEEDAYEVAEDPGEETEEAEEADPDAEEVEEADPDAPEDEEEFEPEPEPEPAPRKKAPPAPVKKAPPAPAKKAPPAPAKKAPPAPAKKAPVKKR